MQDLGSQAAVPGGSRLIGKAGASTLGKLLSRTVILFMNVS